MSRPNPSESEIGVGLMIGFMGIFLIMYTLIYLIAILLLFRVIIMFYSFNKYKYNLLVTLLSIITLVVLNYYGELHSIAIILTIDITGIALLILSYFPLSNSVKRNSTTTGSNNNASNNNAAKNKN